jgi:hypothetical protein
MARMECFLRAIRRQEGDPMTALPRIVP